MLSKLYLRHALVVAVAIAAVLASAAAASSGNSNGPTVTITPVRPYQPGDKVWTSTPPLGTPTSPDASPLASGCQRVPGSGYIGHDVYAQTTVEYADYWDWSAGSSNESFSWYIKLEDGTIEAHGSSSGGGGSQSVPANDYYWQVQNTGSDPQAWNVCYSS